MNSRLFLSVGLALLVLLLTARAFDSGTDWARIFVEHVDRRLEMPAEEKQRYAVLPAGGWKFGQELAPQDPLYLHATIACSSAIIVMQIVNVFLCRSASR